ncbi:centrosomal protein of 170 kDa protein B isoform X1 [Larimichthys crocea]|uniref:centrosomal protein of 170 kDa protein B isoform X1 n=1 Tax=Larimichthys crocea TaxID=215358 RepID=UPI000F5FC98C|nr:centrosomal protein of 170 kDa protein B isoform X1 [Larimichthys crocea]
MGLVRRRHRVGTGAGVGGEFRPGVIPERKKRVCSTFTCASVTPVVGLVVHIDYHLLCFVRGRWTLASLGSTTDRTVKNAKKILTRGPNMSVTSWFLVSSSGTRHRLPREMIFVGRDDCELMLQSRSVDKQHAVINYDKNTDEHMVKDLGSLNGTFVNDLRIPDQTYITLKLSDVIRFGYDTHVYILEKSQHKVPEEALKHEKYTSQLQLSIKALEAKAKEKQLQSSEKSKDSVSNIKLQDRAERRAHSLTAATDSPISKPTPLYGQPSWWGEDEDPANKMQNRGGKSPESPEPAKDVSRYEVNGSLSDSQAKSIFSYRREPSYFEIPTKESQPRPAKKPESQVHEVPTKDTPDPTQRVSSTSTPPVVQSHASFTIEFDECTPGKMKIKDHVTKFSFRQQRKLPSTEAVTTPTEVMSAQNKVADWLVQSNASMMRRRSRTEEMYSTHSDPSHLKITKANHSEDSNHGSLGHPVTNGNECRASPQPLRASPPQRFASPDSEEPMSYSPPESQSLSSLGKTEPHQAFVIEFFDDNSRKKRSQSFTNNTSPPEPSGLRVQLEKTRKSTSPTGERQVPSPACSTPPTQRYTVPLKSSASTGPQRAGSLRREKTEDRISTGFSSRSTSSPVSIKPFNSVGRRSKLAKEFTAEFLKQAKQSSSASLEKNTCSSPTAAKTQTMVVSPTSPPPSNAPYQPQTSSPIHQPVPLKAPVMPPVSRSVEVKSVNVGPKNEEEDTLSDAGTYTIETDIQDRELEEARSKIDQVFGVFVSPERTNESEAETSSAFRPDIVQSREQHRQNSCGEVRPAPEQGHSLVKGAPKWMSCWASLADSYTESGPSSGLFDIPSQMELSGGARGTVAVKATPSRNHDSTESDGSRARRILPQVPLGEKSDIPTPGIYVHRDLHSTFDAEESSSVGPRPQDGLHRLSVQDDVEPDSLSDASKSDDGSIIEQNRKPLSDSEEKKNEGKHRLPFKSTSFYIGSEEDASKLEHGDSKSSSPKAERKPTTKTFSTATLTKPKSNQDSGIVKPSSSAPVLGQGRQSPESRESSSLIRQESFTKERPSNARLPNISSQHVQRDIDPESFQGVGSQDTHSYLKETEDVLAVLEAKLQAAQPEIKPSPIVDSLSGESDVDTSSTVSQHSSKTRPNALTKKPSFSGLHRERSSASIASQHSVHLSGKSEKWRSQGADSKTEPVRRPVGLRRSVGKRGSTDLSDDPQSLPYSDQESNNHRTSKKYTVPLQKEDGKASRVSQALGRANSLSAPRPTRASMLRRARLGEASDNEGTETDRLAQEASSAPTKQPQETKKLSRLDMLAMPRKRTSSFNTPSDTEASSTPQWTGRSAGFSNRSTESGSSSVRKASVPGQKPVERPQKAALSKTPVTRARSSSAKYASSTASSRRRQKGSDYTSTSDEEYDSNQSTPKHKRSQPSSASHSPRNQYRPRPQPQPVVALRPKARSRDSEDEKHEGDTLHNWSNHSAEIARLSQDLAKDLAILAREIHDVAGDGELQNPGVDGSAPGSTVTTHEQLVHHIPEAGLNYQRVPPGSASAREPDQSSSDHEPTYRQQTRSRDEVMVDNLMLNPVSQIIVAIKENTEQLSDKIKVLFQDRMDIWQDIEAKVNSDNDVPVVKTSNKEITSILKELRRVQRQLEVINTVMEPGGQPEGSKASASAVSSAGIRPSRPPTSRDFRTVHSASTRGGGPRPGGSIRRAAMTPDDLREGHLV